MPRPAGAPNKNKRALQVALRDRHPDYDVVMYMADIAVSLHERAMPLDEASPEMLADALAAHDKVAQYVVPKLKAIEHRGEDGGPFRIVLRSDDESA